ncbi:MAG: transcription elongation factor GreA [Betaproteobacteria bacterium AqS2]|uniref:Transcription elongation factor GreA n=1 Tax=Candidatus Amphirhobacter heronislandensis TaxID=1732024 RepID=A0A930XXE5_9GAMM|nr:transcription elongation factor GreA [Betaproteobacteria bacterium AqS2]
MADDGASVLLTAEGMASLKAELDDLVKREKPALLTRLAEARAHGDLSENAEYHAVKELKALADARIIELHGVLGRAEVFKPDPAEAAGRCVFGSEVEVKVQQDGRKEQRRRFKIVSSYEADAANNSLSMESPLGSELLGKEAGDVVEIDAPAGLLRYEIVAVSY